MQVRSHLALRSLNAENWVGCRHLAVVWSFVRHNTTLTMTRRHHVGKVDDKHVRKHNTKKRGLIGFERLANYARGNASMLPYARRTQQQYKVLATKQFLFLRNACALNFANNCVCDSLIHWEFYPREKNGFIMAWQSSVSIECGREFLRSEYATL